MIPITVRDKQILKKHLYPQRDRGGISYFSSFIAILRDARKATGRNRNGVKIKGEPHNNWLGALGYLVLLDQIGNCFKAASKPIESGNKIRKALKYFSNCTDSEINSIYALSCSFAHNYSLSNIFRNCRNKPHILTQRFKVIAVNNLPLVIGASSPWKGEYRSNDPRMVTRVNLVALGDLVEEVIKGVRRLAKLDQLEIVLPDGINELKRRFALYSE
jgi:hypothetical protein